MDVADRIARGDRGALARALTLAENGSPDVGPLLLALRPRIGRARRIGFTGPPGAGKSTLVSALVRTARARGQTVAVLAVDPSSPFTLGALLGDRIRMNEHALDAGVFIRSQSSRGAEGGLSATAPDMLDVLDAGGFDVIFVETVGVGQAELEVVRTADVTVAVVSPNAGDVVQAMKAGLLEAADVIVVNKADLPGAEQARNDLIAGLELAEHGEESARRVILVSASSGVGVADVLDRALAVPDAVVATRREAALARRLDAAVVRELLRLRRAPGARAAFDAGLAAVRAGATDLEAAARAVAAAAAKSTHSLGETRP